MNHNHAKTLELMTDLAAMLEHYALGRPMNWDGSTKSQALKLIAEARAFTAQAKKRKD